MVETRVEKFWKADQTELTMVEKIRSKQTISGMPSVQEMTGKMKIVKWVLLHVHNDKLDEPEYQLMEVTGVDDMGEMLEFNTSSASFIESMIDMFAEITDPVEAVEISVVALPSNNFKERSFYTARIEDILCTGM